MDNTLDQINTDSRKYGIILSISGPLSQDLMVEMGEILKRKLRVDGADDTVIHKVFSILVELNQNIIHYSAEKVEKENGGDGGAISGCGIMSVGFEKGHYFVMSGNMIKNDKIKSLTDRLIKMNSMDKEELNLLYREQRKGDTDSESKGAGLGLVEVARTVSQSLEFDFEKIEGGLSFFTLKTVI